MKKLLACGLILSTLMSFGSVCFAMENGHRCSNEFMFSIGGKKGDGDKHNKSPKPPRSDEDETEAEKHRKNEQQFKDLRDQAIALLSGYYEEGYGLIWYTTFETSSMKIGDLSDDGTILKAANAMKQLPRIVSETLAQYLALRKELSPETMMEHHPLFIYNVYGLYTEGVSSSSVCQYAKKGRKQLDLTFYNVTEVCSTISELRDNAISHLYGYFQKKNIEDVAEKLSKMKLGDIVTLQQSLMLDGTRIELSKAVWDVLWEYLNYREAYFPETMKYYLPLFVNTKNPKQTVPLTKDSIRHYCKANGQAADMEE